MKAIVPIFAFIMLSITACSGDKIQELYKQAEQTTENPSRWAAVEPQMKSVSDSTSYLLGYLYGSSIENSISRGSLPLVANANRLEFEKGVAMALAADSLTVDVLYGIMAGLELRRNLEAVSDDIEPVKWDRELAFKGFYQGLNRSVSSSLPPQVAEDELNRILRPFFLAADTTNYGF